MSKMVVTGEDVYIVDDVPRQSVKLSLAQCLDRSTQRPIATPMKREPACPALSTHCVNLVSMEVQDTLQFSEADQPVWNLKDLELEEYILYAAQQLDVCRWNEDLLFAEAFELYTDGSFNGTKAGWAVVIVAHWNSHHAVLGTCSGAISEGLATEIGVEIPKLTAQVAEQVALVWAHWWLLRFARTYDWQGQVYFRWDSVVPGKQALGDYSVQTPLGQLLRALAIALEQQQGDTHVYHAHVRAHQGILLNEIADATAKLAREDKPKPPDTGHLAKLVASVSDVNQVWWMFCNSQFQNQLPAFSKNTGILHWSTRTQPANKHSQIQAALVFGQKEMEGQTKQCHFRFASYNVLSLLDPQPPPVNKETGRARLLREQVQEQGIHFLGLQESRSAVGAVRSHTHMRLCSGAETNGTLGVELWISTKVPVQGNKCLDVRDFTVLHADPRCLLAHYDGEFGAFLILVAHAPHTGHPTQDRVEWWSKLNALVQRHRQSKHIISLIDANATWAGPPNAQMGDLCEATSNSNTAMFVEFVEQFDLFAPSTFADCQYGPWFTWTHARTGREHRIDYVLLPSAWARSWIQAWTDPSVTVGHAGIDHVATIAVVHWEQGCVRASKKVRYDRNAILHPNNRAKLFDILDQCPRPAWEVNASDHAIIVSQYLQEAIAETFPAPKAKTPKYTKDETRNIYQELVSVKRASTQFRMVERFRTLALAFRAWAGKPLNGESRDWLHRFNCRFAQIVHSVQSLTSQLRIRLRKDRTDFLEALAKEVNECPPGEIFKKLRPILKQETSTSGSTPS